jgi:acyl carrier protein
MTADQRVAVRETVELVMGLEHVGSEDRLLEDLGAESSDVVNIIAALEDRFSVGIPEEMIPDLHSVGDLQDLVEQRAEP